jgi:hypothetical protein
MGKMGRRSGIRRVKCIYPCNNEYHILTNLEFHPIQISNPEPRVVGRHTHCGYQGGCDRREFLQPGGAPRINIHNFSQRGQTIMTSKTIYPSSGLDDKIPSFLAHFYSISDNEHGKKLYPEFFTEDASFTFIAIKMSGHEGIPPSSGDRETY